MNRGIFSLIAYYRSNPNIYTVRRPPPFFKFKIRMRIRFRAILPWIDSSPPGPSDAEHSRARAPGYNEARSGLHNSEMCLQVMLFWFATNNSTGTVGLWDLWPKPHKVMMGLVRKCTIRIIKDMCATCTWTGCVSTTLNLTSCYLPVQTFVLITLERMSVWFSGYHFYFVYYNLSTVILYQYQARSVPSCQTQF